MIRAGRVCCAVFSAYIVVVAVQAEQVEQPPGDAPGQSTTAPATTSSSPDLANEYAPWRRLIGSLVVPDVPKPIFPREVDLYATILQLSAGQRAYVQHGYEQYVSRLDSIESKLAPPMLATSAQMTPQEADQVTFYDIYERWRGWEEDFLRRVADEDDALFEFVHTILAEPQIALLERVRLHRDRRRCVPTPSGIMKAGIDLSLMLQYADPPFEITEVASKIMWEYEQAVTPAITALDQLHRKNRLILEKLRWQQRFDDQGIALDRAAPGVVERIDAASRRRSSIDRSFGEAQSRVAANNDQYMPKLAEALNDGESSRFVEAYRALVYPRAYPDHLEIEPFFEEIRGTLDAEMHHVVNEHWKRYRTDYERLCSALESESLRWQTQHAYEGHSSGWRAHDNLIIDLTKQRAKRTHDFMKTLWSVLPRDTTERFRNRIDQWNAAHDAFQSRLAAHIGRGIDPR